MAHDVDWVELTATKRATAAATATAMLSPEFERE